MSFPIKEGIFLKSIQRLVQKLQLCALEPQPPVAAGFIWDRYNCNCVCLFVCFEPITAGETEITRSHLQSQNLRVA